jgi:hypothetical protein
MFSEHGGRWGVIDIVTSEGVEICLMYFTEREMTDEIGEALRGRHIDKEADGFYPVGRCATLLSMHAIYDANGYIAKMKDRLAVYPAELAEKMLARHMGKADDREGFERAVSRRDALYYHEVADTAIDHFLQALFALNKRYFPSRKRSAQHIDSFERKPADCVDRLLYIIEMGGRPETLHESYAEWRSLYNELAGLASAYVASERI